ncbi:MAG: 2OG-Fe(II) oxygenase [Alphaproteobacteria bacterium]|nr:2OG-Fe(II) oxygenase [Alphaproteobacteria bacterium]MBV9693330.1 2OG-Fe(II) oxygenase [Alphaproteobacteria bacterium]
MEAVLALDDLRRASAGGDMRAATALATRLLSGREAPFEPEEGASLIRKAVEQGDAQAMAVLATLKGAGAWTDQSWPESLDLLQRAAEGGADEGRSQLIMLAQDQPAAARARDGDSAPSLWRDLRQSVDLEKWVTPQAPRQVFDWPKIWLAENFATAELCGWLIGRGLGKFRPSMMFDGQKSRFLATRTCSDFAFTVVEGGVMLLLLRIRIGLVTSLHVDQMEPPQIFHYALGQEIKPHFDSLYDQKHPYGREGNYQGDRLATFLMYLNDGYEGGVLEFPRVGFSYKGKTGDGIFFASMREGKADRQSLHGAGPITEGEKYILSQWIHDRPFAA